jgi:hypothetical protein
VLKAGVGDHGVDPPEALDGRLDRPAVALSRREVGGMRDAGAVRIGREVHREHVVAAGDQALGDGAADAPGGPGDDGGALRHDRGV